MATNIPRRCTRKGFSLVELSVVVIVIGVLAAFGVPRWLQSVERSKASEAYNYLAGVRSSQERYRQLQGAYATSVSDLDMTQSAPVFFNNPAIIVADETTWTLTLTRLDASTGYGAYTVAFNQDGYDSVNSTIVDDVNPRGR